MGEMSDVMLCFVAGHELIKQKQRVVQRRIFLFSDYSGHTTNRKAWISVYQFLLPWYA
jgi:hypothetical protein